MDGAHDAGWGSGVVGEIIGEKAGVDLAVHFVLADMAMAGDEGGEYRKDGKEGREDDCHSGDLYDEPVQ